VGGGRAGGPAGLNGRVKFGGPQAGRDSGLGLLFFSFLFFFKSISNLFKPFFYIFSNLNFNTNFSKYFKGFSQTIFLQLFKHFKFKLSFFFNSNFYTNFHKLFHNYF
jgi:hypothetical protein